MYDDQWVKEKNVVQAGHVLMREGVMCLAMKEHSAGREVSIITPAVV